MTAKTHRLDRKTWLTIASVFGSTIYLALFFSANPHRLASLTLILLPDEVLHAWVGGDWGQFALIDRLTVLSMATMNLMFALAAGWLTLHFVGVDRVISRLETAVFSLGIGLNHWSLFSLAVALCGGLQQSWLFLLVVTVVVVLAAWRWQNSQSSKRRQREEIPRVRSSLFERFGMWLALPFCLLILLGAAQPPWEFDVREYHLQVPKEWFLAGEADFLPHNVYGNMPLGAEMHVLLAMALRSDVAGWWWGALAGKVVMASFSILTAFTLLAAGNRYFGRTAGVIAALVFISTPWIGHVSQAGLVEGVFGCYLLQAVFAWLIWWRNSETTDGWLWISGYLAGGAAACKYPALLFVIAPLACATLLRPWFDRWLQTDNRVDTRQSLLDWRRTLQFSLVVVAGCGLWYGKNAALTGNPIYPLLLGGMTRDAAKTEQWNQAHQVPLNERGQRYSITQAADSIARIGWRSELLSPLLLPLVLMAMFTFRNRRVVAVLVVFAAFVMVSWWLFTHRIERFLVPLLPVAALLAGSGAVWNSSSRGYQMLVNGFVIIGMATSLMLMVSPLRDDPSLIDDTRYFVSLDRMRRDEPAEPGGPSRVNPAHRWLNDHLAEGNACLLVGDAQPFDVEVPVFYNTCFDDCIFEQWMKGQTRANRLAAFRDRQISHVFVHWSDLRRYRQPGNYGYSDYVTPERIHGEFVEQHSLLQPVDCGIDSRFGELFEVVYDATND